MIGPAARPTTWPIGSMPACAETASAAGLMNHEKPPQPASSFRRSSVLNGTSPRAMRSNSGPPGHALSVPLRVRSGIEREDRPATGWSGLAARLVQRDGGSHELLERVSVDLVALGNVDRAPRAALEARVEEPGRIVERRPLGEGQLHLSLVRLAGADDPVVLPHGNARARLLHPLHVLGDVRISLPDQPTKPCEGVPAPVPQPGDPLVDPLCSRLAVYR